MSIRTRDDKVVWIVEEKLHSLYIRILLGGILIKLFILFIVLIWGLLNTVTVYCSKTVKTNSTMLI